MSDTITTPKGRIVGGSVFKGSSRDFYNNERPLRDGAPDVRWHFALAIPKTDPGWHAVLGLLNRVAHEGFPGIVDANGNLGAHLNGKFAWKYEDGDAPKYDDKGVQLPIRSGYPGSWILKINNLEMVPCFDAAGNHIAPDTVKLGFYAQLQIYVKANGLQTDNRGIYVSANGLRLISGEPGDIIETHATYDQMFGADTQGPPAPGTSRAPATNQAPATTNTPPARDGFAANAGASTPPVPNSAPAVPGRTMLPKAKDSTYENFIAQGWTEQMLIDHGYMVLTDVPQ